ncbi:hypothetical protein M5C97_03600 [Acidovorax sp. NCPPB 3859]|nr:MULTISPECIES: hypothetical protein [unclassified Acidovorax]MDA8450093.1 hypothetical protein [Acidovorax sp. GBBC 3297]MDA8459562.1 hypothetical protein [Acidovorax sp. GBBC 3333]MDA8464574.1 hypothetical protein [Acidovorax sp. GBBC 3332]MDA8469632.1 hypothetical protein [Acidovorax sp. GBBC 3299]WCM79398.1 hypothetical protein M5C94_03595 [Acidovorax sp. GBBC 712]
MNIQNIEGMALFVSEAREIEHMLIPQIAIVGIDSALLKLAEVLKEMKVEGNEEVRLKTSFDEHDGEMVLRVYGRPYSGLSEFQLPESFGWICPLRGIEIDYCDRPAFGLDLRSDNEQRVLFSMGEVAAKVIGELLDFFVAEKGAERFPLEHDGYMPSISPLSYELIFLKAGSTLGRNMLAG